VSRTPLAFDALRERLLPGVRSLRVRTARPARTFPAMLPFLKLDRIYLRGFAVRQARVLSGQNWKRLSDHAAIVADLELG